MTVEMIVDATGSLLIEQVGADLADIHFITNLATRQAAQDSRAGFATPLETLGNNTVGY